MASAVTNLLARLRSAWASGGLATTRGRITVLAVAAFVIAAISAGLVLAAGGSGSKQVTAYFANTIGVYPGSTVRILGVPVGSIDSVTPVGQQVRVTMTVNGGVPVPANADAVVVAPSVVSDRYIQLIPAYTGGPQMASGAVIPQRRTATPVEVDQLYSSLVKLASALGPNGVNSHGALSDVINTGAANLSGNGKNFNTMIDRLGAATRTLSGSRSDLFATVNNLQSFTTMLKSEDSQVRLAEQQFAQVSGFLAGDRQSLGAALNELATALGQVKGFIQNNRSLIKSNVSRLAAITRLLVIERASLTEAINDIPLAVDNVVNAYDPVTRTLDGRGDLNELSMGSSASSAASPAAPPAAPSASSPASGNVFCAAASTSSPLGTLCRQEQASTGGLVPISPQALGSLPPLPLPAVGPVYGSPAVVPGKRG
jgi:phospholipid/cholesterol/gamma-HCH transport system substrate-binding protein